ncbi:MAG TPA: RNA polymerase sigma factor, partial [Planctomycetota bacterium]
MGGAADSMELEELLTHAGWVRRVATALVRDPGAADDLAQEVWLRALEKRPEGLANPRAWLASVARSLAATGARGRTRRRRREEAAARREGLPAADEVLAEAEREREVAALVLALEEPYRSVVLLRYYRDLPPRRIAEELGRPVATVKVQLQRGLAQLRTKLDRRHGGREAWGALLLPLCVARVPLAVTATASLAAISLLAMLGLWWRASATPSVPAERAVASAAEPLAAPPADATGLAAAERPPERSASETGASAAVPAAPETAPVASERRLEALHARLVTLTGEPLAGVRVAAPDSRQLRWASEGPDALVADGFWLPLPAGQRAELARSAEA